MRAKMSASVLFLLGLMVLGLVACGTDSGVAASQADEAIGDVQNVPIADEVHDDGDGHADVVSDTHEDEATGGHGHMIMAEPIDPDAPVTHITASEFAYGTTTFEVEAGKSFSVQISNEGMLEHDITIVGFEEEFGLHVQPGEDNIGTFEMHDVGEYVYYCTILGHREAGMTGTLVVSDAHDVAIHDEHDEVDGQPEEATHDEADGHHDNDAAGA